MLCVPLVYGFKAKQEKPNKKSLKREFITCFALKRNSEILKQHERKIKQNKQSGTKNVEQNDAKNLFESKKKKWKGREIKLFVSYEAKKLYFCFLKNVKCKKRVNTV